MLSLVLSISAHLVALFSSLNFVAVFFFVFPLDLIFLLLSEEPAIIVEEEFGEKIDAMSFSSLSFRGLGLLIDLTDFTLLPFRSIQRFTCADLSNRVREFKLKLHIIHVTFSRADLFPPVRSP